MKTYATLGIVSMLLSSPLWAYSYGDPSIAEQVHLEAINRARANPVAEATRLKMEDLLEGVPAGAITTSPLPPLTLNALLSQAANGHSQLMADKQCFAHRCADEAEIQDRITATQYDWEQLGENVALRASTGQIDAAATAQRMHEDLFKDLDYPNRAHRVAILTPGFKEIGISLVEGNWLANGKTFNAYFLTTDYGTPLNEKRSFVLGVVYNDRPTGASDADGLYTAGEGLGGITVEVLETGDVTKTASAGGYALPLHDGNYTLRFTDPSNRYTERKITVSGQNVKQDVLEQEFNKDWSIAVFDLGNLLLTVPALEIPKGSGSYYRIKFLYTGGTAFKVAGAPIAINPPSADLPAYYFDGGTAVMHLSKVRVDPEGINLSAKFQLTSFAPDIILDLIDARLE